MSKNIQFHFKNPDDSSGYLLWQVTMLWQRAIKKELDTITITHTQFVLLATIGWLSKHQAIVTQIDIANHSNTDRMMVSKVLRTLQEKKMIIRQPHETDTRAKTIMLSQMGVVVLQKALKLVEQADAHFFLILKTQRKAFNKNLLTLIKQ
jgi:DNA-binding MarR family transcriptional regulator